jgi:hypothetical protein
MRIQPSSWLKPSLQVSGDWYHMHDACASCPCQCSGQISSQSSHMHTVVTSGRLSSLSNYWTRTWLTHLLSAMNSGLPWQLDQGYTSSQAEGCRCSTWLRCGCQSTGYTLSCCRNALVGRPHTPLAGDGCAGCRSLLRCAQLLSTQKSTGTRCL